MASKSAITCINFGNQELHFAAVDVVTDEVLSQQSISYNFEALNTDGGLINPSKTGKFVLEVIKRYDLPGKIRIGINLKFLEIKTIFLPQMPENELIQVINDESIRESIFSFTTKEISVASKIIGKRNNPAGTHELEVLTATIPTEVINSYIMAFENTGLKILSIQPLLEGIQYYIEQRYLNIKENIAFIP